jgi:HK97 family phage major capsid protein
MSLELKRKLAQVQDEVRALNQEHADKVKLLEAAREKFTEAGADTDSPEYEAAREAMREAGTIADQREAKRAEEHKLLELLQDPGASPVGQPNGNGREPAASEEEGWNSAHLFTDEMKAVLAHTSGSKSRFGALQMGEVVNRDRLAADITGTTSMRRGTYVGIVPQIFRPLRVLDLIPIGTADGNSVPYTQESGTFGALETAEGASKPEDGVTFTDALAPVQTIAAWQKIRKQALADYAAIRSMIDGRLRYSVMRRLEGQILNGDGTGSNLTGVLNTSGIGTVAFVGTVPLAELVLTGITNVYLADAEANGVVVHPSDWQKMLTLKSTYTASAGVTGGSGEYFGGGPFANTPLVLWGVPLLPSPAIPAGSGLVADFAIGAQLLVREGVQVLMSDSDQSDFIQNRVTLLGEMRAALPVWRPTCFQKVALA